MGGGEGCRAREVDMSQERLKFLIPVSAGVLLVLHLLRPEWKIDAVTLGLLVVALLPWLFSFVESLEFPGGWKVDFRELERRIEHQDQKIENQQELINELVIFTMAYHLFRHLRELYDRAQSGAEYLYRNNPDFKRDLIFLRDHGFIESAHPGQYLDVESLRDGQNLIGHIKLTPVGNFYVQQRQMKEGALHRVS